MNETWLHHMPIQLKTYGEQLTECASDFAKEHKVEWVLDLRDIPDMDKEHLNRPEHIAHVISSAARWALFWAARGHGMEADFLPAHPDSVGAMQTMQSLPQLHSEPSGASILLNR